MATKKPALQINSARENNLKSVSLEIPHNELTVITGLSGSGKSSLAFDTVYAEGQRRYIETFSPYTRQFFDKVKKPDADSFSQVRPAIAIQQRTRITSSRSTVGSLTNINDYLKILWFNLASPHCPNCQTPLVSHNPGTVSDWLYQRASGAEDRSVLLAVSVDVSTEEESSKLRFKSSKLKKTKAKKVKSKPSSGAELSGSFNKVKAALLSAGFSRFFDESEQQIKSLELLEAANNQRILVVIDRFSYSSLPDKKSLADSLSQAFNFSVPGLPSGYRIRSNCILIEGPSAAVKSVNYNIEQFFAEYRCLKCSCELPRIRQSLFSFNHPLGACPTCKGFGHILEVDPNRVVPNKNLSIEDNAIVCWSSKSTSIERRDLLKFCSEEGISIKKPWKDLSVEQHEKIFNSKSKTYWGVLPWFKWLEKKTYKMHVRVFLSRYRSQSVCPECDGTRLVKAALAFRVLDKTLPDSWQMPIADLYAWICAVQKTFSSKPVWSRALAEVVNTLSARLHYLCDLGLSYLTLDRQARTLSGGETQRVNLASALGSDLVSTQFVLDEPSVGLHPRDTAKLIKAIQNLAAKGNSVLMVEHDLDCIDSAEHVIEMGPKAGTAGGEVVFQGPAEKWPGIDTSKTARINSRINDSNIPATSKEKQKFLTITNASARNLKGWDLKIPLGKFVCLSGPSGSGKSSLVHEVIVKAFQAHTLGMQTSNQNQVSGFSAVKKLLVVDQSPLTKSPRANIATFSDIWEPIRKLLAETEVASSRGLSKSSFSFNVDGGRCSDCKGAGFIREDMQFLSDVYVPCETCLGKRFKPMVLEVELKGKSVSDLLSLSIDDAKSFFSEYPDISDAARTLSALGLGHLTLGHSLSELSGGEAQRLKLVPFVTAATKMEGQGRLARGGAEENALLIFDEPTTGLHFHDVQKLIALFELLRDQGHSIICIEHNLSLLAACDYMIDLGPEGGEGGGQLLWQGSPSDFLSKEAAKSSSTAFYLAKYDSELHTKKQVSTKLKNNSAAQTSSNEPKQLEIIGAREHNLKNLDVSVPFDKLVAICGVSGSGKSSIAKDIIYAEGQRRYLDCLSPYARQFIKELKRPEIDEIRNVKPTICVYQHTFQPSRLSTVATMSEIYNYLRLLYAKVGTQYCPDHPDKQITPMSAEDMAATIKAIPAKTVRLLAPIVKLKKGTHRAIFQRAIELEISQLRVDGVFINPGEIDAAAGLTKSKAHSIDYVIAKFNPQTVPQDLLAEAIAQGLSLAGGTLLAIGDNNQETVLSSERTCPLCKRGFFKPDPEDLSFNSKRGRCPQCSGSGYGKKGEICKECGGARINSLGRSIKLGDFTIHELCKQTVPDLLANLKQLKFQSVSAKRLAAPAMRELEAKAEMLEKMGLDYISLSRDCSTLSGGELQRLRLATAVGSTLSAALFIFDEPSAGLHPNDNQAVLKCLRNLCDQGNSVLIIEHDKESILACDYVIDVGPGGGKHGGEITFAGSTEKFKKSTSSPTAIAFRENDKITEVSEESSNKETSKLELKNGNYNSIKNLSLNLPLNRLVTIAGVSGAGKSSLVHGIIRRTLIEGKKNGASIESNFGTIKLGSQIDRILEVDQSPIGINSRSTPASYLKIWDHIRLLFANSIEAQTRGWGPSYFSYNAGKGRCPECLGLGQKKLEMSFLPDARVECESCLGKRFSDEALSVTYLGLNAHQVLALSFEELKSIFANHPKVHRAARLACELGLGYLTLGQSSTTLSGGESQRIKLVSELSAPPRGHTLYILDEPTTGLHKNDVTKLMAILKQLVERGNSVFVIEHDVNVIMDSDWVVEMGPGPGERGGKVVFEGIPSKLKGKETAWGKTLSDYSVAA